MVVIVNLVLANYFLIASCPSFQIPQQFVQGLGVLPWWLVGSLEDITILQVMKGATPPTWLLNGHFGTSHTNFYFYFFNFLVLLFSPTSRLPLQIAIATLRCSLKPSIMFLKIETFFCQIFFLFHTSFYSIHS